MKFDMDLAFGLCRENNTQLLFVGLGHLNPDLLKPLKRISQLIRAGQLTEWPLSRTECAEHGHASRRLEKKRQVFWDKLTSQLYKSMSDHPVQVMAHTVHDTESAVPVMVHTAHDTETAETQL